MALFTKGTGQRVLELPVESIRPNPNQPRQQFDGG